MPEVRVAVEREPEDRAPEERVPAGLVRSVVVVMPCAHARPGGARPR